MTRSIISAILLIAISAIALYLGIYLVSSYRNLHGSSDEVLAKRPPLNIDGLVFSDYLEGLITNRIEARKLYVRPMKFAGLRIKSVNELFLEGVDYSSYRRNERAAEQQQQKEVAIVAQFSSSLNGLAKLKGLGRVVRGNIRNLNMKFFENEAVYFSLQSVKTFFDTREKKKIKFENVSFSLPRNNLRLMADKAYWNEEKRLFFVPGRYNLISAHGVSSGGNIAFDLDFKIRYL